MQICTQECYVRVYLTRLFLAEDARMRQADASIAKARTP